MKRFLKAVRRFWRGQTRRMRTVYILGTALAIVLVGFGIYSAARPEKAAAGTPKETLFEPLSRAEIAEITLRHANGKTSSVVGYTEESSMGFLLVFGDSAFSLADEPLSELIVGAGTPYVYDTVISAPSEGDADYAALMENYNRKLKEYGFSDASPYYEIKSHTGATHRVYFGSKSVTGGTYYVRLDGRDTVYMATGSTVGDLLYAEAPTSLVNALFFAPFTNQYAYAYPGRFSLTEFVRYGEGYKAFGEGDEATVQLTDRVGYTAVAEDGSHVNMITLYPIGSSLSKEGEEDLLGRSLGDGGFEFNVVVGHEDAKDENGNVLKDENGKVIKNPIYQTHKVVSIDYIDRGDKLFDMAFVNKSFRDLFHQYSIYEFTTSALKNYLPDTDAVIDALEKTTQLTGTVVALDFSANEIKKYGLEKHMVEICVPVFEGDVYRKDEFGNVTDDIAPTYHTTDMLYVSAVTERGTRYVGTYLYSMVIEVDASALAYLEDDLYDWVEPSMIGTSYEEIVKMRFDWSYSTKNEWLSSLYDFTISYKDVKNDDGATVTVIDKITAKKNGDGAAMTIDETIYRQLYYRMLYARYAGGHDLSDEELAALLADESKVALSMTMTLSDGSSHTYRFIPISADRVLVSLDSEDAGKNASFYIYGSVFKAFARGYVNVMEGTPFEHENKYQ